MFQMNKQRQAHSEGETGNEKDAQDVDSGSGQHGAPHIHISSHEKGHTVHIMHKSGKHESHEHAHGDAEGIAAHIHQHLGSGSGSTTEDSSGDEHDFGV